MKRMAINGMMVSGRAVPTAARTLPIAPSEMWNRLPVHSIPFVKNSQAARIMTKLKRNNNRSIWSQSYRDVYNLYEHEIPVNWPVSEWMFLLTLDTTPFFVKQ